MEKRHFKAHLADRLSEQEMADIEEVAHIEYELLQIVQRRPHTIDHNNPMMQR